MSLDLTPDQINQLRALGINTDQKPATSSVETCITLVPQGNLVDQKLLALPQIALTQPRQSNRALPLLSISGLTLVSFGGILMFKSKETTTISAPPAIPDIPQSQSIPSPTQVPKSIQHYLLASQQYFSQALQQQTTDKTQTTTVINYLNQSIIAATDAIKEFPQDYRGYQQRGRLYQTLTDSQPQFVDNALSDLSSASKLNPNSSELTHDLALLYAKKGDATQTINYLQQTVNLEPTKAQNFYDLAKLQQQVGLVPQALDTYNRLLPLITDPTQKSTVTAEKSALESLLSQSPTTNNIPSLPTVTPNLPSTIQDAPTLQADNGQGLVIAAPETAKEVTLQNQTESNSLAGDSVLPSGQKSITLTNSHIGALSKVYLTTTKGGKNLVLQVLSKSEGSAIIGLDAPTNEEISFKWWIIE